MFDSLFSPTHLDGKITFVPTEGGLAHHADGFPSRDAGYSYQEQCEDDNYLVVPSSKNRPGASVAGRLLGHWQAAQKALGQRIGAVLR